jgi:hypothetical protein
MEQIEGGTAFAFYLLERAIAGCFVRPPPQKLRPMPKPAARKVIKLHLDHKPWR